MDTLTTAEAAVAAITAVAVVITERLTQIEVATVKVSVLHRWEVTVQLHRVWEDTVQLEVP